MTRGHDTNAYAETNDHIDRAKLSRPCVVCGAGTEVRILIGGRRVPLHGFCFTQAEKAAYRKEV